jgi:hypothetical protein
MPGSAWIRTSQVAGMTGMCPHIQVLLVDVGPTDLFVQVGLRTTVLISTSQVVGITNTLFLLLFLKLNLSLTSGSIWHQLVRFCVFPQLLICLPWPHV